MRKKKKILKKGKGFIKEKGRKKKIKKKRKNKTGSKKAFFKNFYTFTKNYSLIKWIRGAIPAIEPPC